MDIELIRADMDDSKEIHEMQVTAFRPLLEKYGDADTNPGAETLEMVKKRFALPGVHQYLISFQGRNVGYIRIQRLDDGTFRLSQMFILPDFQGRGYAQAAIRQAESRYPEAKKWELDTIKQETKLRRLYEKMGYKLTGTERNIKSGMDLVDYAK